MKPASRRAARVAGRVAGRSRHADGVAGITSLLPFTVLIERCILGWIEPLLQRGYRAALSRSALAGC